MNDKSICNLKRKQMLKTSKNLSSQRWTHHLSIKHWTQKQTILI